MPHSANQSFSSEDEMETSSPLPTEDKSSPLPTEDKSSPNQRVNTPNLDTASKAQSNTVIKDIRVVLMRAISDTPVFRNFQALNDAVNSNPFFNHHITEGSLSVLEMADLETITNDQLSEDKLNTKKRKHSENGNGTDTPTQNGLSKLQKHDAEYFSSYADIELHRTMIEDQIRTNTYRDAIMNSAEKWIKGKVVADVGCGTGILSMFCAQAGAKKVYAIEASEIGVHAKKLIEANGFKDIVTVMQGRAEDIELPEKVDVIVSEWMGYMLLYETMLPSVLHIRDKWLKPDGKMFPERAVLHMALAETQWITKYEESAFDFWISLNHVYSLDMSHLADHAVSRYKDTVHIHMVSQDDVMSFPTVICDLDLYKITSNDLQEISHDFTLSSMGSRFLNSIVLWFDVWFPDGSRLSTSPDMEDTHWQNTVLSLPDTRLQQDANITGNIKITQDSSYHRHLNVKLDYSVSDGPKISRTFKLDDNCIDSD